MIIFFLLLLFILFPAPLTAQSFDSTNYHLDWGNFNVTSGRKTSGHFTLTDTVGQIAPGKFNNSGYVLKSGFQYIYDSFNQFSFQIDDLDIAFNTLTPNIGTTDTNTITITTPSGHGYQIMAHENHPLWIDSSSYIPDTSCNIGSTCTPDFSNLWTESLAYGFGFNAIGINTSGTATNIGTSEYFPTENHFRPFADYSTSPNSNKIFMSENQSVKNHSARITYKVNVSTTQASGNYQNSITFTAVPKY